MSPTPRVPLGPPTRLPAALRGLWEAVHEAAKTRGRGRLAAQLGVSTHTLQRILVDGRLPDFQRASVRQTRSWARTIVRLADHFGADRVAWLDAAGIPREALPQDEDTGSPLGSIRRTGRPTRLIAVDAPRLADHDRGEDAFLLRIARRLLRAVDPRGEVLAEPAVAAREVVRALERPGPVLAVGLSDCAWLRGRGIRFLPLPGWRPALEAIVIRPLTGRTPPLASWDELAREAPLGTLRFAVADAEPGLPFVQAHWSVPADRVLVTSSAGAAAIGRDVARAFAATRDTTTVAVFDEALVRAVLPSVRALLPRSFEVHRLAAEPDEAPRFPLALAVGAGNDAWADTLEHAFAQELYGAAQAETARLYADTMRAAARALPDLARHGRAPGTARPDHFATAGEPFRRVVARELLGGLLADHELDAAKIARDPAAAGTRWDEVLAIGHALLPVEWSDDFHAVAWAARADLFAGRTGGPRSLTPHCFSCSQSLHEHPGAARHYCRYCADESGRLRPRDEVHRLIAGWMERWQEGITREEAWVRAERYMSAMPAWSAN